MIHIASSTSTCCELLGEEAQEIIAAQKAQTKKNLERLASAMYNYHDVTKHFPPPVLTGPDGKTKYSWRVAILPYLGARERALYERYRRDEPWDSEHNRKVLAEMPSVFRSPTDREHTTTTAYHVLVGETTVFPPKEKGVLGVNVRQITDGPANTLMIVESKRDIPWTKPEDLPYDPDEPLPELGGFFDGIFHAAFAFDAVRAIPTDVDPNLLRRLIEKADGETILLELTGD